ncbi:alpha/Beta hydrolase fold protein [Artemisia annua]|uniref:Alpha/Beta hydrolase fold protein n=1 Tax=Artemisia annua TaxID=35608 RepID=A0A2U1NSM4_ARTAN|nr:alpha/Beta hydrolase fold protein [Artemisia annua]
MNIWVPKEIVTKKDGNIVYIPPTKPAVVLLHAFAMDGILTWFLQVLALSREYSVYVPDLLFFGGSITNRNERSASFQAEFVAKGLGKLQVEKLTLVGLSYGGMVGFKMAKLYPDLVKSFVASATVIELTESISVDAYKRLGLSTWSDLLMPTTVEGLEMMFSVGLHKLPWIPKFIYRDFLECSFPHELELSCNKRNNKKQVRDVQIGSPLQFQVMFNNRKERNELLEELVVPDEEAMDTNYSQAIPKINLGTVTEISR